jgi:predicted nucleotidyltransferase
MHNDAARLNRGSSVLPQHQSVVVERGQLVSGDALDDVLREVLRSVPGLELAFLFGSLAQGQGRVDSDVDLAVRFDHPLSAEERVALIDVVAQAVHRPVDLVDLRTAGEPTLGQVMRHGRRIWGSAQAHGDLLYRQLVDQEDFGPLQRRILEARRRAWIGK